MFKKNKVLERSQYIKFKGSFSVWWYHCGRFLQYCDL